MTENYKQVVDHMTGGVDESIIQRLSDGAFLQAGGRDWVAFEAWKLKGNTPAPADTLPKAPISLEDKVNALLKGGQELADLKAELATAEVAAEAKS